MHLIKNNKINPKLKAQLLCLKPCPPIQFLIIIIIIAIIVLCWEDIRLNSMLTITSGVGIIVIPIKHMGKLSHGVKPLAQGDIDQS